ncbi:MAG: glycosyltransferase family 39 protein [Haloferacaceae archaeon]
MIRRGLRRLGPIPLLAGLVAVLSGVVVFLVASTVFAYHSSNHDEGVYLLQAAMLLEGQLELSAGDLAGAFRPWFFVQDGGRLYPKYTPVPAAMYAVSMAAFGEPRVTLAAVAAGNASLVYLLGAAAFDRRVGLVAAVLFSASPLALITTSTFLPYAPTTFLNLLFAVAYLRSVRDGSAVAAVLAGVAIGLAFFARPYTAVLFAAPFVLHAAFRVASALRRWGKLPDSDHEPLPDVVRRHGLTAALGLLFVGVTLAYNYRLTGSPLLFPYEAFAPQDGPGFGRRRILSHSIAYTPATALEANGYVLRQFATRWFTAGPIGTALALGGLTFAAGRWRRGTGVVARGDAHRRFERTAGGLLAALFVTVPLGNVFFWGNYNVLGTPADPTDGLVSQFGPFYHFDLLAPLSLFAAVAAVAAGRAALAARPSLAARFSSETATVLVVGLLVASVLVVGGINAVVASGPLERNAAHADKYATAYEPIERESFDDALVFVPTPYGDWQNHPFQYLRNGPGFDGPVVYALDRGPDGDFAVLDAYPDRQYYRYTYRGEWTPKPDRHVAPKLEPLEIRSGAELSAETVVGVPDRVEHARVRLETVAGTHSHTAYGVDDPGESLRVDWSIDGDVARLGAAGAESAVRLGGTDVVVLTITLVQPEGSTLTYRQETTVRAGSDGVEVIWPPERYVCSLVTDCGTAGTYLPDRPDAHRSGVSFETRIEPVE